MGYVHIEISIPLLLYHPTRWRDTTCNNPIALPLHSLTVSFTQSQRLFYNATIQYTTLLQCFLFIGELPWENTMGHPKPWVHKLLANKDPKIFFGVVPLNPYRGPTGPHTLQLGWVYSKTGVQTWLNNNIFESWRSVSTTNTWVS